MKDEKKNYSYFLFLPSSTMKGKTPTHYPSTLWVCMNSCDLKEKSLDKKCVS